MAYPIGHKDYGKMGPKTIEEYQSLNFSNKDIKKITKKTGPAGSVIVTKKPVTKA